MRKILKDKINWLTVISAFVFITAFMSAESLYCQDDYSVGGFIDEDGDGFNDLLPDSDGDGVPDGLDPDSEVGAPDTSYMYRYMHNYRERHQMMWENMNGDMPGGHMEHGEPGMYGPGDSTMHGGQEGGHEGGGHHGGGMGGGTDPGDGMGGGGGMRPDSEGGATPGAENELAKPTKEGAIPEMGEKPGHDRTGHLHDTDNQGLDKTP